MISNLQDDLYLQDKKIRYCMGDCLFGILTLLDHFSSGLPQYFILKNILKLWGLSERIHGYTLLLRYELCAPCLWALSLSVCNTWMTAGPSRRNLWLGNRVSVENLCSTHTQSLHCEKGQVTVECGARRIDKMDMQWKSSVLIYSLKWPYYA